MSRSSSGLSARSTIYNSQPSLPRRQNRLHINCFDRDDGDDFSDHEADNDNYPLPPHVSELSRKRGASDSRRGPRKVHIQFDTQSDPSSSRMRVTCFHCFPHTTSTDHNITVVPTTSRRATIGIPEQGLLVHMHRYGLVRFGTRREQPMRVGLRSGSFFQIPDKYKALATRASGHVRYYIPFENPMLSADDLAQLLAES